MESILVFIFVYAIFLVFDLIPIIKKKEKKAIFLYIPVFLFTLVINILEILGTDLPNPNTLIQQFIQSLMKR